MDKTAFFTMTSGLYVVSAAAGDHKAGCVVNTAVQVTSSPARISVAVNKENFTAGVIADAGAFAVTVIDQTADMIYIGNFGFRTSANFDKFERYEERQTALGMPYVPEHATALFSCRLVKTIDVGTHLLFVGEVEDAQKLSDETPLTYDYYHKVLKGKTPPRHPRISSRDRDKAASSKIGPHALGTCGSMPLSQGIVARYTTRKQSRRSWDPYCQRWRGTPPGSRARGALYRRAGNPSRWRCRCPRR